MAENWSLSTADTVAEGIYARIRSLAEFPARWPLARESKKLNFDIRQAFHGNKQNGYRILFRIYEEPEKLVCILTVRHSARRQLKARELKD